MIIHYDTHAVAVSHLQENGWVHQITGNWVSKDKTCKASIHPVPNSDVVCIFYLEIE